MRAARTRPAEFGQLDWQAMPRVLLRLTRLALRYPWRAAMALACSAGSAVFNLVTPALLGHAIDQANALLLQGAAQADAARHALWTTAALLVAACAARGTLTGAQGYLGENLAQRVGYDLRLAFYEKLQRLSFSFHDRVHSGDLIARGMLDLEGVRAFLEIGLLRSVTLVLLVAAGAWRLMGADVVLGALALSFVPFVVWRAARLGVVLRLSWDKLQTMMSRLALAMEENLQGVRVVRAFASRAYELARFDAVSDAALALSNRRITLRMEGISTMNLAYYAAMGAVLWAGGARVADGRISVGLLAEVLTFMTLLQLPVRQVAMIVNSSARAGSSGARLFEILDSEPEIRDAPGAVALKIDGGGLRFDGVGFTYPGTARAVLHDITFELRPGCVTALVGPPGSGKSTVAQLMARFYDVDTGRITIDGQDLRSVTLESLRRAVGLVQQEVFLFDTSIHHNVAYADPAADEERVAEAAATAQIHEHVETLPQGYGTRVGERGVALSGGQRQRVALARTLLARPAFIVLDDATSAVDARTEGRLRQALHGALRDQATLVIAHRLASVRHADEILVLDRGRIAERGTHAQLLALGGHYAVLWALQHPATESPATMEAAA